MKESRKGVPIDLLVFTAAASLGMAGVLWILRHPDYARTVNMRACLVTKRASQSISDAFQVVADNAATQYNSLRNVVT